MKKRFIVSIVFFCVISFVVLHNTAPNINVEVEKVQFSQNGNSFELRYLVTLHGVKSAELDDILPTMHGYEFRNVITGLEAHDIPYRIGYEYHSGTPELGRNQFLLILQSQPCVPNGAQTIQSVITEDGINELPISLTDIGYWEKDGKYVPFCSCSYMDVISLS